MKQSIAILLPGCGLGLMQRHQPAHRPDRRYGFARHARGGHSGSSVISHPARGRRNDGSRSRRSRRTAGGDGGRAGESRNLSGRRAQLHAVRRRRDLQRRSMTVTIAILGRPNVGKSTLFNRLAGRKLALVDDQPGVTRDRREGEGAIGDLKFRLFDTAGLDDRQEGEPGGPHERPGRDGDRRGRSDLLRDRRAGRRDTRRPRLRRSASGSAASRWC